MATGAVSSSLSLPSITCDSLRLVRDPLGAATGVVFVGVALFDAAGRDALGAGTGVHAQSLPGRRWCVRRILFQEDVARCKRWGDFVPCGDSVT